MARFDYELKFSNGYRTLKLKVLNYLIQFQYKWEHPGIYLCNKLHNLYYISFLGPYFHLSLYKDNKCILCLNKFLYGASDKTIKKLEKEWEILTGKKFMTSKDTE